ncbi:hypothetical protein, partial [uncultured Nostoc sp.]|uniref:hypothetical protein n=1 Tax=uncultured Nostoc sp. TaxID=340711 RepID=UPI0035CABDB8
QTARNTETSTLEQYFLMYQGLPTNKLCNLAGIDQKFQNLFGICSQKSTTVSICGFFNYFRLRGIGMNDTA